MDRITRKIVGVGVCRRMGSWRGWKRGQEARVECLCRRVGLRRAELVVVWIERAYINYSVARRKINKRGVEAYRNGIVVSTSECVCRGESDIYCIVFEISFLTSSDLMLVNDAYTNELRNEVV